MANVAVLGTKFESIGADKLNKDLKEYAKNAKKAEQGSKQLSGSANRLRGVLKPLSGLFAGISVAMAGIDFFNISRRIEDFESSLVSVTGGGEKFRKQIELLNKVTSELPLNMAQVEKAFVQLNGNGIEPTADLMEAFANAASITRDKVGALDAAVQVWARSLNEGAISLEEMDKLADRGIPVYQLLADTFGITRGELLEFSKEGDNTAKILQTLQREFLNNPMFNGAARRDMETTNGQLTALNNNWNRLVKELGTATSANSAFVGVLKGLNATLEFLADNASTVVRIFGYLAAGAIGAGVVKLAGAFKALQVAIAAGTISLKAFRGALIATGVGAIVVAVGELVAWVDRLGDRWSKEFGKVITTTTVLQATWSVMTDALSASWSKFVGKAVLLWNSFTDFITGDSSLSEFKERFENALNIDPSSAFNNLGSRIKAEAGRIGSETANSITNSFNQTKKPLVIDIKKFDLSSLSREVENLRKLAAAAKTGEEAFNSMSDAIAIQSQMLKIEQQAKKDEVSWNNDIAESIRKILIEKQQLNNQIDAARESWSKSKGPLEQYKDSLGTLEESMQGVAVSGFQALEDSLVGLVMGTKSAGEAFKSFATTIISELARAAIQAMIVKPLLSFMGFAKGGVFQGGQVQAFAKGGIVDSPTIFPMANGMGLMGEAGAEAIMPLTRTSSGDLGVRAVGSSGGSQINNFQTNVTIQAQPGQDLSDPKVAEQISKQITRNQEAMINQQLQRQMKSGGILNPSMQL